MNDQQSKREPVWKQKRGSVEAAVWENTKDGRTWHNVAIYRRYKTDGGQYREAHTYALADLVQVARLAEQAEEWLTRRVEGARDNAAATTETQEGPNL